MTDLLDGLRFRPHEAHGAGVYAIARYANGYGASVICTPSSYGGPAGLHELAVLRFSGPDDESYELDYSTPITADVLGWLTLTAVEGLLRQIAALPEREA